MVVLRDERGRFVVAPLHHQQQPQQQQDIAVAEQPLEVQPHPMDLFPAADPLQAPAAIAQAQPPHDPPQLPPIAQNQQPVQPAAVVQQGNAAEIGQLRAEVLQLLAITQQQQAAIALLQNGPAQPQPQLQNRHVNIKLPPFFGANPRLWFSQVEAQFSLFNVADKASRYAYIVGQLDERGAKEVVDLIETPPAATPYTSLKNALIDRVGVSEEQRLHQLLSEEVLGDRTPSQFLRHLRSLSSAVPERLLRSIWARRLPTHVRAVVQPHATDPAVSLQRLATIADEVLAVSPNVPPTFAAAVSSPPTTMVQPVDQSIASIQPTVAALTNPIASPNPVDDLTRQLTSMLQRLSRDASYRSKTPPPRRSSSRDSRTSNDSTTCWYHQKFGARARKCSAPCSHPLNFTGDRH